MQVRVKPETAEVELEMAVQVDSENYDADDDKAMPKQVCLCFSTHLAITIFGSSGYPIISLLFCL